MCGRNTQRISLDNTESHVFCYRDLGEGGNAAVFGRVGREQVAGGTATLLPDDLSSTDFYMPRVGCPEAGVYHSMVANLSQKKSPKGN
jgi:hypothetical protein